MNKQFKRFLGAALVLALLLATFCVTAGAAQTTPNYPHLSVGAASLTRPELKKGETVKIPVSLAGLTSGQYLSGFSCNVVARNDDYLTITGVEFAPSVSSWAGGYNASLTSVNKVYLGFAEHPENSLHSDGLLFNVVCEVAKDIPAGTSTGITISEVSMNQKTSSTGDGFLNSPDGTETNLDRNAIIYPVDADGNPTGGVLVPEKDMYVMTVTATPDEVELDDLVTVKVTVTGGVFSGAEYKLHYDTDKFVLDGDYSEVKNLTVDTVNGTIEQTVTRYNAPSGTEIAAFTFKALPQDIPEGTEVTGEFTLQEGIVSTASSGITGDRPDCTLSAPAVVKFKLSDELTVSAPNVSVFYDGNAYGVTATANKPNATIRYMDENGDYTLIESPKYTDVGEHTVKFSASLKGYVTATGEATVEIKQPVFKTETVEYVDGYTLVLVYTNEAAPHYTYDGRVMLDVSNAGYTPEGEGVSYDHVYGWVVEGNADTAKIKYTTADAPRIVYSGNVNAKGSINLDDVTVTLSIFNADELVMQNESYMHIILRADVNHDKQVTAEDWGAILNDPAYVKYGK